MKRIFITFLFIFAITLSANAQGRLTENFAYTAGDSIGAHGWVGIYNGGYIPMLVTSPGLTYTGYPLSGIGNACTVGRVGSDYYKNFSQADSTGSTYCSFMLRVDSSTTTGDYFFALLASNSTTNFTSRLTIKDTLTNQFRFGLSKGTVPNGAGWSGAYNKGTVYVVVVKYTFNPIALDDLTSLYVFETGFPVTEPVVPTILPVLSGSGDANNLGRVALRSASTASSPKVVIDGIRVGRSWPDIATTVKTISTVADKFALSQNYPNPFNPSTTIRFSLPANGMTSLKVYDLMGKEVSSLVNGSLSAGEYTTDFNAATLASGMYFYRLEFNGVDGKSFSEQRKLMLVK